MNSFERQWKDFVVFNVTVVLVLAGTPKILF